MSWFNNIVQTQEKLVYFASKSAFPVWPRDFVVVIGSKLDENGGVILAGHSVNVEI